MLKELPNLGYWKRNASIYHFNLHFLSVKNLKKKTWITKSFYFIILYQTYVLMSSTGKEKSLVSKTKPPLKILNHFYLIIAHYYRLSIRFHWSFNTNTASFLNTIRLRFVGKPNQTKPNQNQNQNQNWLLLL